MMTKKRADIYKWELQGLCPERTGRRGVRPGMTDVRKERGKWGKVRKPVGKVEKLKMLAKFVELSVVEVFEAHVYEYGGRIFVQSDGGPIGLSLSGAIGRTTMAVWDGEVGRLCKENGIVMRFRRRYVDDCNGTIQGWRKGWRWGVERMEWKRGWEKEEMVLMEEDDVRCWREWAKMVDTIWQFIQVTYDCPGLNNNGMVPILDLNVRMEWHVEEVEGLGKVAMQQII